MCKKWTEKELEELRARYSVDDDEYDSENNISCCHQWCCNPAYPDCSLGCDNYYNEYE